MGAIKTGWDFFQDQILGMHWLKDLIGNLLVKAGMGESRFPGEFLHFFIYDVIKIFVLLAVLIFLISYIQSYFPPERSKKIMGRFHGIWANIIGALLGTVTPFCSCSSIPIFMGFTRTSSDNNKLRCMPGLFCPIHVIRAFMLSFEAS